MAHKHKHPCACCGRGIASHRTKAKLCSKTYRDTMQQWLKYQASVRRKARG